MRARGQASPTTLSIVEIYTIMGGTPVGSGDLIFLGRGEYRVLDVIPVEDA